MRIALVSPYSWTYPGGVTRHIEALADELRAQGQEARILTPHDPDDARARRMHRGARPQARELPEHVVPLGRTIGLPANGAISNLALTPAAVLALREELREGGYDVVHIHEPIARAIAWDALGARLPLVGTFHCYSENALTNGAANLAGARRRFNRLHARIAVSRAAEWTARRFFGGRYTIVPNGVHIPAGEEPAPESRGGPLRILFVGQAVERKGLPVALRAFEALREHVPATLTLVGASPDEVAPLLLDDRGVMALGKVSEAEKARQLARADVLCAPSLGGESFGMVLTEAFAARTPVVASDIPGYRDVVRDGREGILVPPGDAVAVAEALRTVALDGELRERMAASARERAERFAWPRVAGEVFECYERAVAAEKALTGASRTRRLAVRRGLACADMLPAVAPERHLARLQPTAPVSPARRALAGVQRLGLLSLSALLVAAAVYELWRIGVDRVAASVLSSSPALVGGALGLMCASMFARALAWHAILRVAPGCRRLTRREAMRGTFIGVLMSATLPARLGEPARALVIARRLGRTRETLPVVLGTILSQTLLNLAVLCGLGVAVISTEDISTGHAPLLIVAPLAPLAVLWSVLIAPVRAAAPSRPDRLQDLARGLGVALERVAEGLRVYRHPREALAATGAQLGAWALQWLSCWLLLMALGLDDRVGAGGAAAVLFAVNVTAAIPATPANVGVFQAACVAVLTGAYRVGAPDAIAYGIILQAIEIATALLMGMPALLKEGMSWRELRLRALHASPVKLGPLPTVGARGPVGSSLEG